MVNYSDDCTSLNPNILQDNNAITASVTSGDNTPITHGNSASGSGICSESGTVPLPSLTQNTLRPDRNKGPNHKSTQSALEEKDISIALLASDPALFVERLVFNELIFNLSIPILLTTLYLSTLNMKIKVGVFSLQ